MPRVAPRRATIAGATVAALLLTACGAAGNQVAATGPAPTPPTTSTTTSPVPPSTAVATTAPPRAAAVPPPAAVATGVGTVSFAVVDPTRPTVQYGHTLSDRRTLPTIVRYPAVGPTAGTEVADATPAAGPWPLVIFAHGYNVTPATYAHLEHAWAAAGFVVAAPAFPLETAGGPLDENDLNNEPADISAVITSVLARSSSGQGTLAHLIDPSRIAVTGHSDGAEAALAAGFDSNDARIGPVISMAAQGIVGGAHPAARHPLLVVQGDQDTINPPARSDHVYAEAGSPKFYLRLLGAGHLPPVADDTPWRPIVEQVGIDFLRHAWGSTSATVIATDGNRSGLSTLVAG